MHNSLKILMFTWAVWLKPYIQSLFSLHSLRFGGNSKFSEKIVKKYWRLRKLMKWDTKREGLKTHLGVVVTTPSTSVFFFFP